jgi:hypothetical protein
MESYNDIGSVNFQQALSEFFNQRLKFIEENKYPAHLVQEPPSRFIMHFIPEKFQEISIDLKKFDQPENHLLPLGELPETIIPDYNYDGLLFVSSLHTKQSYTQLFRDGKVEMVAAIAESNMQQRGIFISLVKLQQYLIHSLNNNIAVLHKFFQPGPFYLYFRLIATENLQVNPADINMSGYDAKGRNRPLVRETLVLPHYRIDEEELDFKSILKPFFDILWNTFGFPGCPE